MEELQYTLGYFFRDPQLLKKALSHRSYAHEKKPPLPHNEVLELLGDAVLNLILTEGLIRVFPEDSEGDLSKKRASLVKEYTLSKKAEELGLPKAILLGKGELLTGGEKKPRLLASCFEALVGALYLEAGFAFTKACIDGIFSKDLGDLNLSLPNESDFKTRLQEWVQRKLRSTPEYRLHFQDGPAHNRVFQIGVLIQGVQMGLGFGPTKKKAEQGAAQQALNRLMTEASPLTELSQTNSPVDRSREGSGEGEK